MHGALMLPGQVLCISHHCLPADELLLSWGWGWAMEGRPYSFFLCHRVQFHTEILLALTQKDHLRAEARKSLEIVQPAVPLSQEAEHSLWCSSWHIYVSLYSLVLSKAFGKLSALCICQGSSLCVLQVYLLFTSCSTNYVTEKISRLYVNDTCLIFHPGEENYQN